VCEIEFVTGGDARLFPVALASMFSKYLRELYMHVFNRYWSRQHSGLRPTAGYYTDARRWLEDAAPVINRLSIDRGMLVRER
jgi:ribonuclease HII